MLKNKLYRFAVLGVLICGTAAALAQMTSGQSVADAAHTNHQTKAGDNAHVKVWTNDDFSASSAPTKNDPQATAIGKAVPDSHAKTDTQAQSLRAQVLQEKEQVAKLKEHLDRLQKVASDRVTLTMTGPLTPQVCALEPERCESQRQAAADLTRTQQQLASAQQKLQDLQDKLRKQGYGANIWDP